MNLVASFNFESMRKNISIKTYHIFFIYTDIEFSKPSLFSMVPKLLIMSLALGSLVEKGASGKTISYTNSNMH